MQVDHHSVWADVQAIKKSSPLVHNITNYVVMEQTANSLLAIGASPVMAHALEEVEDMARLAGSLVLNIGTLSPSWVKGMEAALKAAQAKGIPIVLDPVGSGATPYRTSVALALLNQGGVKAIRGNASEIISLFGSEGRTRGVNSSLEAVDSLEEAKSVALSHNCIVWMTGKTDIITDGNSLIRVHNGHPLMGRVTGMGCTATAITGAFLAVNEDPLLGCAHAAVFMGIAGEITAKKAAGPGSFKVAFIDGLYNISLKELEEHICLEIS